MKRRMELAAKGQVSIFQVKDGSTSTQSVQRWRARRLPIVARSPTKKWVNSFFFFFFFATCLALSVDPLELRQV